MLLAVARLEEPRIVAKVRSLEMALTVEILWGEAAFGYLWSRTVCSTATTLGGLYCLAFCPVYHLVFGKVSQCSEDR